MIQISRYVTYNLHILFVLGFPSFSLNLTPLPTRLAPIDYLLNVDLQLDPQNMASYEVHRTTCALHPTATIIIFS